MSLSLSEHQWRAIRHGLIIAGLAYAAWTYLVVGDLTWQRVGTDAYVYWGVNAADPYAGATLGGPDAFLYSPAFAQVFSVIGLLPREVFLVLWIALLTATAVWLARPWLAALLVLALPLSQELMMGNIHLLLAAAIVLSFRWAGLWAFVLLTKVTPGVGLLWFVVRREWRQLIIVAVVTGAVTAVSYALNPGAWQSWFDLLVREGGPQRQMLPLRIVLAAVITVWGAWTDRPWVLPAAAMIALPVIWSDSRSMLLGCVALTGAAYLAWRESDAVEGAEEPRLRRLAPALFARRWATRSR